MKFFTILTILPLIHALNNCPAAPIRTVIQRATETTQDAITQMQMIRRILEDIYGGTWGVLLVKNPTLISKEVHWTFPDHLNSDGSPAFCLTVVNGWQYNVFKTGQIDSPHRVTVESMISKFVNGKSDRRKMSDTKQAPKRYSVAQLDRMLSRIMRDHIGQPNKTPRLINQ